MGRKKVERWEPWRQDGKRFVASLQKPDDPSCYKDFFDSENLAEAKAMATNAAQREKRKAIVFDRAEPGIVFRCDFTVPAVPQELPEPTPEPTKKKGRVKRK